MGETGREVETACRTQVRVGVLVLGVDAMKGRLWWDWVKRVRGVEIAQVLRACKGAGAWYGTMQFFTRRRWWGRSG